ncbi:MAG: SDR family oxidoreductase [Spirochaetota bacterium]
MSGCLFDLKGKIALVTGSSRGLGFALAKGLCRAGAKVIINGIDPDTIKNALTELRTGNFKCSGYSFDITNTEQTEESLIRINKEIGIIDILVNNAGTQYRAPITDFPREKWDYILNVNLSAPFWLSRRIIPGMIKAGGGKIINICSLLSDFARKSISAYTVSKGGLKMLTKSMATELGKYNIQVNGIGPGYFSTEMNIKLTEDTQFNNWVVNRTPAGRWGRPEDLEGAIVFLASKASDYVNGQILFVDGGFSSNLGGP